MPIVPAARLLHVALLCGTLATGGFAPALHAQGAAQDAAPPRYALAIGWSPAAGLIGGEVVRRPGPGGQLPVGFAVGAGLLGPGARVHVALGRTAAPAARRVPYAGVGYTANAWADYATFRRAATAEGGVQFWPARRHRVYADLGAGAALVSHYGGRTSGGPVLRALVGMAF